MADAVERAPVLIVGAGPAGLATTATLAGWGIRAHILEAGAGPGESWRHYYEALRLHTGRAISGLPGFPLPPAYPLFVPRAAYLQYLRAYTRRFQLAITPHQRVLHATHDGTTWRVQTADRVWAAPVLVAASGIASRPHVPPLPGLATFRGPVLHTSAYHNAAPFAGQRVLLVGLGNSGAEIALDLRTQARAVTVAVRGPVTAVPRVLGGVPVSYVGLLLSMLPPSVRLVLRGPVLRRMARRLRALGLTPGPPDQFPVIGLEIFAAMQAGQIGVAGAIAQFTPGGVDFADGSHTAVDAVVLATGFRPALDYLADYVPVPDQKQARLPVQPAGAPPHLYCVGFHYDGLVGTLYQIGRQARWVAARVRAARTGG